MRRAPMHRAFAAWLIAKPWRAFLLAAILGLLSPQGLLSPIAAAAGAIPVLMVLNRGRKLGIETALTGCVAVAAFLLATGTSLSISLASIAMVFVAPVSLALILERTGSLQWCFQVALLAAGALLIGVYVVLDDPVGIWRMWLQEAVLRMTQAGLFTDEQAQSVVVSLGGTNWGTLVSVALVTVLSGLFLGAWWHSLLQGRGTFGTEFQKMKLGTLMGGGAVLLIVSALVLNKLAIAAPLLDASVWLAFVALAYQGLAAAHRLRSSGRLGPGWLAATYVLLVAATPLMVMLLAGWGAADNWRRRA